MLGSQTCEGVLQACGSNFKQNRCGVARDWDFTKLPCSALCWLYVLEAQQRSDLAVERLWRHTHGILSVSLCSVNIHCAFSVFVTISHGSMLCHLLYGCVYLISMKLRRRSGQSVTASDFGSNGPQFQSGHGRCVESLDKALYSHCPKEKPSH